LFAVETQANDCGYGTRITSVYRNDGKIHSTGRALDATFFRLPNTEPRISAVGKYLEKWINDRFIYGKGQDGRKRNVAWWHDTGSGYHLHLQVPPQRLIVRRRTPGTRWTRSFMLQLGDQT
jgi:hypothetical protein